MRHTSRCSGSYSPLKKSKPVDSTDGEASLAVQKLLSDGRSVRWLDARLFVCGMGCRVLNPRPEPKVLASPPPVSRSLRKSRSVKNESPKSSCSFGGERGTAVAAGSPCRKSLRDDNSPSWAVEACDVLASGRYEEEGERSAGLEALNGLDCMPKSRIGSGRLCQEVAPERSAVD